MVGISTKKRVDGAIKKPRIQGFRIPAVKTGSTDNVISALSTLNFLRISKDAQDKDTLIVLNVESRDISKTPYLFSICYFRADAVDVLFSETAQTSPKLRKLNILTYVLNLLTLSSDCYEVNVKYLYQLLESTLSDLNEYASSDYQIIFSKYDALLSDYDKLQRKISGLQISNKELANENYSLRQQIQELKIKIQNSEKYSDSVLAVKIQDWITEHNGEINLSDFSQVHNVSEARVEQVLNRLVSEGYLDNKA